MPPDRTTRPALAVVATMLLLGASSCGGKESPTDSEPPVATSVAIAQGDFELTSLGEMHQLSASVLDQFQANMSGASVIWSSSNDLVASVSPSGRVTAVADGVATITAESGDAEGSVTATVNQTPASVTLSVGHVILEEVDNTATVGATVSDALGNEMTGVTVTWSSSAEDVADVSATGVVTARGDGASLLTATVEPAAAGSPAVSASIWVVVGSDAVLVTGTDPAVLVEGAPAEIQGFGFSVVPADNVVTLGGLPATVSASSLSSLQIVVPGDCEPPREATLLVEVVGTTSPPFPVGAEPEAVWDLAVGEGAYATNGCLALSGGAASDEYLVGALSLSEAPSSVTPSKIQAREGAVLPGPPAVAAALPDGVGGSMARSGGSMAPFGASMARLDARGSRAPVGPPRALTRPASWFDRSGEAEIRRKDRLLLEALGRRRSASGGFSSFDAPNLASGPQPAVPSVGETLELNVPNLDDVGCTGGTSIQALVRHVGTSAVWLEDVANPVEQSFTVSEYTALDQTLSATILPTITSYAGGFEDIDANGRTLVLVTKEVNETPNLGGFVFSGDLFPATGCDDSNEAELFYGIAPDPDGDNGEVITKSQVLDLYPSLIAHEITHVSQFTRLVYDGGGAKVTWEWEGGATLTEQLVGFELFGHGPGQDLGATEWEQGGRWYFDWAADMASYFGFSAGGHVSGAPEECSWLGRESEGNNGPCNNGRAPYGVPSTLFRWVLDAYGSTYPGGEAALMRRMVVSPHSGLETLVDATGEEEAFLLSSFAATLWADGRLGDWLASWDIFDVFGGFLPAAQLQPYTSSSSAPTLEVSVRGGSSSYLEWSPPGPHLPTSLRLGTPEGGPAPAHMVLWVVRVQ